MSADVNRVMLGDPELYDEAQATVALLSQLIETSEYHSQYAIISPRKLRLPAPVRAWLVRDDMRWQEPFTTVARDVFMPWADCVLAEQYGVMDAYLDVVTGARKTLTLVAALNRRTEEFCTARSHLVSVLQGIRDISHGRGIDLADVLELPTLMATAEDLLADDLAYYQEIYEEAANWLEARAAIQAQLEGATRYWEQGIRLAYLEYHQSVAA